MTKFQNVDILAACEQIIRATGEFHSWTFDKIREIMEKASHSERDKDKIWLWIPFSYTDFCFRERDLLLKDTAPYQLWLSYEKYAQKMPVCLIELTGIQNGILRGDFYKIDCSQYNRHLTETALPSNVLRLLYERGVRDIPDNQWNPAANSIASHCFAPPHTVAGNHIFDEYPDPQFGRVIHYEFQPKDREALQKLLRREREIREQAVSGDTFAYITELCHQTEARKAQEKAEQADLWRRLENWSKPLF